MKSTPHKSRYTASHRPRLAAARSTILCSLALFLAACSGGNNNSSTETGEPFAELFQQGILRYLGVYTPISSSADGDVMNYTFGAGDGPLCLDGSQYKMATLDQGSQDLVIFLQGGGGCWSTFCAATTTAHTGIPDIGLLDPTRTDNPIKDWNQVYLPYCDGGLHASDKDNDYDNNGSLESPQRGLHNLSAALDVAVNTFPTPRRIVLTGISGGGFGTTYALPLVRYLYPGVPIELVNDSGIGVSRPDDPGFLRMLLNDWNQSAFIPESCEDCIPADGHLSEYLNWQMDQDPNLRRSFLSYSQDGVIGGFFLDIGGPAFEAALFPELMQLEAAHPDRVRYWVANGGGHTFLLTGLNETAGGVTAIDWVTAMLNDTADWVSRRD